MSHSNRVVDRNVSVIHFNWNQAWGQALQEWLKPFGPIPEWIFVVIIFVYSSPGVCVGQTPLQQRLEEIKSAVEFGATEIDIVINRTLVLTARWNELYNEVSSTLEGMFLFVLFWYKHSSLNYG